MNSSITIYDAVATFHREDIAFGKREAAKLVGGRTRLEKLISEGRIRAEKRTNAQNGKLFCNGGDVLCHIKNRPRKKRSKTNKNNEL